MLHMTFLFLLVPDYHMSHFTVYTYCPLIRGYTIFHKKITVHGDDKKSLGNKQHNLLPGISTYTVYAEEDPFIFYKCVTDYLTSILLQQNPY